MFEIIHFDEIESTNTFALNNLDNLKDRQVIIANKQTCGKGRLGRKWISDIEGNVYLSIVLKPSQIYNPEMPLANLTQYMSVILCRTFNDYGISAQIKWPNDILIDGKKISGLLSELKIQGTNLKGFVLGVGVNLNLSEQHLLEINQPATALSLLLNKQINRDEFIQNMLNKFFNELESFMDNGFIFIKNEYISRSGFLGNDVVINSLNHKICGIAEAINNDGSLLLNSNGAKKIITMGDLFCL